MVFLSMETRDGFSQYCTSVGVIRLSLIAFCSINFFEKCKNDFVEFPASFLERTPMLKETVEEFRDVPKEIMKF